MKSVLTVCRPVALGRFMGLILLGVLALGTAQENRSYAEEIQVGMSQVEITPPLGFPISGYYHERLATGVRDPLWAKAVVFRQGETQAAWVVCDVTGLGVDLSTTVRQRAEKATGIPASNIVISASHSHTGPDYYRALYWHLGPAEEIPNDTERQRAEYAGKLIESVVEAIAKAQAAAKPATLESGSATQKTPVSFCRRFVMKDGSVRTWVGLKHPESIRATAPIDPRIGLLKVTPTGQDQAVGLISNFALHLDTVGGLEWSGDYPYFISESVRKTLGPDAISLFGTGACGDINHAEPTGQPRLKTVEIGNSLGETINAGLPSLKPIDNKHLQVRTKTVPLLLEEVTAEQVQESLKKIESIAAGQKLEFFDHVLAYKRLVLDQMLHEKPYANSRQHLGLGSTRLWKGIGPAIPTEVTVITLGSDTAFVFLPGEIFSELGLAIQNASPFPNTNIVTFAQSVEMIYIPNRHAYAVGGYEVANSLVQPGSGEKLVETAVQLLRESATELKEQEKK